MTLQILVVEGNIVADRRTYQADYGATASEAYAATLKELAPDANCRICFPADADSELPGGAALADFDAVFVTGSSLSMYDGGPAVERQIAFARGVFAARTPFFGSCWGCNSLQRRRAA